MGVRSRKALRAFLWWGWAACLPPALGRGYSREALRAFVGGAGLSPGVAGGYSRKALRAFWGGDVAFSYRVAHFPPRHLWRGGGR